MAIGKVGWRRPRVVAKSSLRKVHDATALPAPHGAGLAERLGKMVEAVRGILIGTATILTALLVFYLVWQQAHAARGTDLVELLAFEVPEETKKNGVTGATVAADVAQRLRAMARQPAGNASSARGDLEAAAFSLGASAGQLDIQVPGAGVSLRDLSRAIHAGFAKQRFEVSASLSSGSAGLTMHVRVVQVDEPAHDWSLTETGTTLEALVDRAARFIAFQVNPYALIKHDLVSERQRCTAAPPCDFSVGLALIGRLTREGKPADVSSAYVAWCYALGHADDPLAAVDKCRFAAQVNPRSSVAFQNWGIALNHADRADEAVGKFETAVALDSQNSAAYFGWGDALWRLKQPELSLEKFARGAASSSTKKWPLVSWGSRLLSMGRHAEGLSRLELAVAREPLDVQSWQLLAIAHSKLGNHLAELEAWRNVAELSPRDVDAQEEIGMALNELGRHEEAVREFERASDFARPNGSLLANLGLGKAFLRLQQYERSIDAYRKSLQIKKTADAHESVGDALSHLDRDAEALAEYEAASRLEPDRPSVYENWADSLLKLERYEDAFLKATVAIEKANQKGEPTEIGHINRAHAALALGRFDEAVLDYRRAAEISPRFSAAYQGWGDALAKLGKTADAAAKYKKAEGFK